MHPHAAVPDTVGETCLAQYPRDDAVIHLVFALVKFPLAAFASHYLCRLGLVWGECPTHPHEYPRRARARLLCAVVMFSHLRTAFSALRRAARLCAADVRRLRLTMHLNCVYVI
jgi:hypothetical protein